MYGFLSPFPPISRGKPTSQNNEEASDSFSARAVDGDTRSNFAENSCTETEFHADPWWQVDLGYSALINTVEIYHRRDCCADQIVGAEVIVSNTSDHSTGQVCSTLNADAQPEVVRCDVFGQFVTVQGSDSTLSLCEVEVYGPTPGLWESLPPTSARPGQWINCPCSNCPAGLSDGDASAVTPCVACAPGRFSAITKAVVCDGICDPGTYSEERSTTVAECMDCGAGQADRDSNAATPCSDCTPGQYAALSATVGECVDCAAGTYSPAGAAGCEPCTPGYQPVNGSCVPVPCPDNSLGEGGGEPCPCNHPQFAGSVSWDVTSNAYVGECQTFTIVDITTQSSGCLPEVGRVEAHEELYCDRHFVFSKVPSFLNGAVYIKASNTDKYVDADEFLCFDVGVASNIYVLFNKQRTGTDPADPPAWLTSRFQLVEPDACSDDDSDLPCDTSSMTAVIEYRDGRVVGGEMLGHSIDKDVWVSQVGAGQVCVGGNDGARDNFVIAASPVTALASHPWSPRSTCKDEPYRFFSQPYSFPAVTMAASGHPEDDMQVPDGGHTCATMEAAGWCRDGGAGPNTPLGLGSPNFLREYWFSRQNRPLAETGLPADNAFNHNRDVSAPEACCCFGGGSTRPDRTVLSGTERQNVPGNGALSDHGCEPKVDLLGTMFNWAMLGGNGLMRFCTEPQLGLNTPECGFQGGNCCPAGPLARPGSSSARSDCEPIDQWVAEGNTWRPAAPADREAVVALGMGLGNFSSKWDLESDPCQDPVSVPHLTCDHSDPIGRVMSISVVMGVAEVPVGTIAPEIGALTGLRNFQIYNQGQVVGTLPPTIGDLYDLRSFSVLGTAISGTVPVEMQNCHRLQQLDLSTLITGTISGGTWAGWPELLSFSGDGQISGTLPPALPLKLKSLRMLGGQVSGTIAPQVGDLQDLYMVLLQRNSISGTLPEQLEGNTKLRRLMLSDNLLSGSIPLNMTQMQDLDTLGLAGNPLDSPSRHP
eukprot:COSAG04_NODE_1248_length_7581_cov_24.589453_6_plen_988_part_01